MSEEKPLTLTDLSKFTQEVLLPAMDERFAKKTDLNEFKNEMGEFKNEMYTFKDEMYMFKNEMHTFKEEMYIFKNEMSEFRSETMTTFDYVLSKLDIILDEIEVIKYQGQKKEKRDVVIMEALKGHGVVGPKELSKLSVIDVS